MTPEKTRYNSVFCKYAADMLIPLLKSLECELPGVIVSDDIESIHQCRVATRRIRAAITVFTPCFSRKKIRRWKRWMRDLTQALGDARDLDVQIEFIKRYIQENTACLSDSSSLFCATTRCQIQGCTSEVQVIPYLVSEQKENTLIKRVITRLARVLKKPDVPLESSPQFQNLPVRTGISGLNCLLLRLEQKRAKMQGYVVNSIENIRDSKVISRMRDDIRNSVRLSGDLTSPDGEAVLYGQAFIHIISRIEDLCWFEPYLKDPDAYEQHHQMRISAKRLRYTLETFSGIFSDKLKEEISQIKVLQEVLGDIHDCDVWVSFLPSFLDEERVLAVEYTGNTFLFDQISPSILSLKQNRENIRVLLFQKLHALWEKLKSESFFENLSFKISLCNQFNSHELSPEKLKKIRIIACISDIHANLPALEAVIADASNRGAELILNAGDLVGYGPFPNEVVNLIRKEKIFSVAGNFDRSILEKGWRKICETHDKKIALRWTYNTLSRENRFYLNHLPGTIRLKLGGKTFLVTHGSPESITEYLTSETPAYRYSEIATKTDADIIITGHSHIPSIKECNSKLFANCGSIGRSEDHDPRACYLLISLDPFSVSHIRVPYDLNRTVEQLRFYNLPEEFEKMIVSGSALVSV